MVWNDVSAAINVAGRGRWKMGTRFHYGNYVITPVRVNREWGIARLGYLTHRPKYVYCAWRAGRPLRAKVTWYCGGYTFQFQLLKESGAIICPKCEFNYRRESDNNTRSRASGSVSES